MSEAEELPDGPRINYTDAQVQAICAYVRSHYRDLFPKNDKPNTKGRLMEAWDKAATALMSCGLPLTHSKKCPGIHLRDLWHKMVSREKKYRDDRSRTGGGPRPRFHQRHEMVLECLPDPCQAGFLALESEAGSIIALLANTQQQEQEEQLHHEQQQQHRPHTQQPQAKLQQQLAQQQDQWHLQQQDQQQHEPHEQLEQQQPQQQQQQRQQQQQQHPLQQHQQQQQQANPKRGRKLQVNPQLELLEIEREKLSLKRQRLEVEKEKLGVLKEILSAIHKVSETANEL